jgi:hypothetical protein
LVSIRVECCGTRRLACRLAFGLWRTDAILPASAGARFPATFRPMFDHVEKLKEYVRCASVSADPQFAPG